MGLAEQFNPQLKLGTAEEPSTVVAMRAGPEESASGTIVTGMRNYNDMVISESQQSIIRDAALRTSILNIQENSDEIAHALNAPAPRIVITADNLPIGTNGAALGVYSPDELAIAINPSQPREDLADTLIHENLHNFFAKGNSDIVSSYKLTPSAAKGLNDLGYASQPSPSIFKEEGLTFDLTSRILSGEGGIYLNSAGELTNVGSTDSGVVRTNKYGSEEYLKAVRTPFKNGKIVDVGTGAVRTLTGDATGTAPEQSIIFSGDMKVERTITVEPTRLQRLFGIGPKITTQSFFTAPPQEVATLLAENPAIVVSQPGGIETTPELQDVYKVAGIKPKGPTTIFHQTVATPQGQEWLGETGNTEGYNFAGKTSKFVMLEVAPDEALPSAEDLLGGRPGDLQASDNEGPKAAKPMKAFDLELPDLGSISSASPVSSGKEEVQLQTQKTIPRSQMGAVSSVVNAQMPAFTATEGEMINVFPITSTPSIFNAPPVKPTSKSVSISGIDPYALASQLSNSQLITGAANLQRQSSITNVNRVSNLNPLSNMLVTSSRSNLLFGSRVGLANAAAQLQKTTQKQTQKQSQKQTQKPPNAHKNPPPTMAPPPIPNYLYGAFAPDQRIKPPKPAPKKPAPPKKGTFKYINDLTSAMFNIHGSKKNKVYGSLGFFRPLS
jgi:hypothetical protein